VDAKVEEGKMGQGGYVGGPSPLAQGTFVHADKGLRVVGYLIDVLPAILLGLFALIPVIGAVIAGLFLTPYWLLRDIGGASIGKLVLKSRVVRSDGPPASAGARVLRNVPIAIAPALLIIPVLGYILAPIGSILVLIEAIMLLTQGDRIGDKLAGTTVVKK
jgi:uncharacterized RDD family membrane protein YckC